MFQFRNIKLSYQCRLKAPNKTIQTDSLSVDQRHWKKELTIDIVSNYHVFLAGRWPVVRLSNTKTRSLSLVLLKPSNVIDIQCTRAAVTSTRSSTTNISSKKHFTGLEDIPSNCTRKNVAWLFICDGFRWMSSYHIVPTFVKFAN